MKQERQALLKPGDLLRAPDIAELLGVSVRQAQRHIRAGRCGPFSEIGGVLRVRRDAFEKAIQNQETQPRPPPSPRRGSVQPEPAKK